MLAGVASVTLADHEVVTEDDLGAQFLVSEENVGKNVSTLEPLPSDIMD